MDHFWLDKSNILYEDFVEDLDWVLVGVPFDSTETNIPGQRLAPNTIRDVLKTKDMERKINDIGNIIPTHGSPLKMISRVYEISIITLENNKKLIVLGGEHTITYGVVKAYVEKYENFQLVYFDAHYDAKKYEHERLTHSTFIRALKEDFNIATLPIGVRRYDKEEEEFAKKKLLRSVDDLKAYPTYISIDLDYFDISLAQGCADKESNGYYFNDFIKEMEHIVSKVGKRNIVGIDIMELNPLIDQNKVTTTLAGDIIIYLLEKIL